MRWRCGPLHHHSESQSHRVPARTCRITLDIQFNKLGFPDCMSIALLERIAEPLCLRQDSSYKFPKQFTQFEVPFHFTRIHLKSENEKYACASPTHEVRRCSSLPVKQTFLPETRQTYIAREMLESRPLFLRDYHMRSTSAIMFRLTTDRLTPACLQGTSVCAHLRPMVSRWTGLCISVLLPPPPNIAY